MWYFTILPANVLTARFAKQTYSLATDSTYTAELTNFYFVRSKIGKREKYPGKHRKYLGKIPQEKTGETIGEAGGNVLGNGRNM